MQFVANYSKTLEVYFSPIYGISNHLYVSQSVVCEMATVQERARCVGWLFEAKSVTQTQRNYRTQFNKQPPSDKPIRDWQQHFLETGSVHLFGVTIFQNPEGIFLWTHYFVYTSY
jgi:hypothetical protein